MFLYIILHMAVKFSRHQYQCFAFSYHRQREISYGSVSHIPVCPRLAAKVWLVWSWPYQFFVYSTGPRSHTHSKNSWCLRCTRGSRLQLNNGRARDVDIALLYTGYTVTHLQPNGLHGRHPFSRNRTTSLREVTGPVSTDDLMRIRVSTQ